MPARQQTRSARRIVPRRIVPRSDDEIVEEALDVIHPPADRREEAGADLRSCLRAIRRAQARWPSNRRETTQRLNRYLKRLRAVKRTEWPWQDKVFLAALNAQIERVQQHLSERRPGARPRDSIAGAAAALSRHFLSPAQQKLTRNGKWHSLAMLLYEATGRDDADKVLKYMYEIKHGKPVREPLLHSD